MHTGDFPEIIEYLPLLKQNNSSDLLRICKIKFARANDEYEPKKEKRDYDMQQHQTKGNVITWQILLGRNI